MQWSWRTQREAGKRSWLRGISESRPAHVERKGDGRFATLASRPPDSLGEGEFEWLVAESAAQQHASQKARWASRPIAMLLVAGIVAIGEFALGAAYGAAHVFP